VQLKNKFEFFVLLFLVKVLNIFGFKKARITAYFVAFVIYYLIPLRKNIVLNNLKIAFPELDDRKIKKLSFGVYYNIAITIIEIFCLPGLKLEELTSKISCQDLNIIKEKLALNKGLIFLTAHFGNWELGASWMGVQLGQPMHVVAKAQKNSYVNVWLDRMREKFGNKVVPLGISIRNIYKEINNKNIIGIVGDQRGSMEGIRVKFFNRNTAVYPGTAVLALRTGVPVVVVLIARQKDFQYKACVELICTDDLAGDEQSKIIEFNQRYMSILEKYIRLYPEQWFWMHNIWKY
jgi:KDO2-lipid IV(A) lauroyltransferase